MAKHDSLNIDSKVFPRVLMLGNGLLKLGSGQGWEELLKKISNDNSKNIDMKGIPYAMRPEVVCGTDVETVQRKVAEEIQESTVHRLLEELLKLNVDAIITTNYTYEIEKTLSNGKWSKKQRKESFFAMDGKPRAHFNTCTCNLIQYDKMKSIPVFHIHGEKERKASLILSYYSYARSVSKLIEYNESRANQYQEHQQADKSLEIRSWLDYFLLGDVYAVGFGFDPSEFDIWWAIERKAREKANHGKLHAFIIDEKENPTPQQDLLTAMGAACTRFDVENKAYESAYQQVVDIIKEQLR